MKTMTFDDYANKYESIHLERQNGILEMRLHTNGGSLVFNKTIHEDLNLGLFAFWQGYQCRSRQQSRDSHE